MSTDTKRDHAQENAESRLSPHQEARKERLLAAAERAITQAASRRKWADDMAGIMNGTPIIVGHHSEGRHRRDLDKMHKAWSTAITLEKHAHELRRRAAAIGTAGISSDDPEAPSLLAERIAKLEAKHADMVRINAAWRKDGEAGLVAAGLSAETAKKVAESIATAYSWEKQPFPGYVLSNSKGNISRLKQRVASLEREARLRESPIDMPEVVDHGVCKVVHNVTENRLQLVFPGKPDESVRALLKSYGFRWSPTAGAWQRQLNNASRHAAAFIVDKLVN